MEDYKRIVDNDITKNYCDLTIDSVTSYVRSLSSYGELIVNMWNEKFPEYYIYFVDGDHWGEQPRWINRYNNPDHVDSEVVFKLNNLITFKDSMIMYSDEFIIFSEKDLDNEINTLNNTLEYTVSAIKIKVNKFIIGDGFKNTAMPYFHELKKLKVEKGRGKIYIGEV